ncbi:xanthine/uracil permease [Spiroplasma chinense]|uniref:Xanthine/uracil permease n=1 Tax=Spiroplasma chinense TaxID=216932 RepID=A0A5B9Y6L5_9MOLU|nr:NCS2 family permease [Spiroplasma chinense]QEH61722.1 xanthine/uracil permease [Spiroplasma chinense]
MEKDNNVIGEASKSKIKNDADNSMIAKFFGFSRLNTSLKKEIIGGVSTFLAMVYILSVEPSILSSAVSVSEGKANMSISGLFLATAFISFLSTFIMGISANVPIAVAPSMGLNAMFTYSVAANGIGYEGALFATLISGVLFCIITITKVRTMLIKALPKSLHLAIGIGIGFFIAYVGITNMGWVKTLGGLPVADLNNFKMFYPAIILGTLVLFGAILLHYKKFVAPIALMMVIGFVIAVILANTIKNSEAITNSFGNSVFDKKDWNYKDLWSGFTFNIKSTFDEIGNVKIWKNPTMYISTFVFTILTFFDATGTLTLVSNEINRNIKDPKEIPDSAMLIDGSSSIIGSLIGVSHTAAYSESCVGISQGARTGFASIITSIGFLISILLFPIFKMMPDTISGAATVFIGIIMIGNITEIEWKKPEISLSAFFTILFMIITYNIAVGVGMGLITYTLGCIGNKKAKEVHPVIWVLSILFIGYFVAFAFIQ